MALLKKPKQKLISVSGAQAKAKTVSSKAKAVKPGKKKSSPLDRFKDGGGKKSGEVDVGGKKYAKVYNRSPK
jgi:hypothetical protein